MSFLKDLIFGAPSKQQQTSQSTSQSSQLSIGGNAAASFGTSGSDSLSQSQSSSTSQSGGSSLSQSTQGIAFEDLFRQLYGGATAAAGGIDASGISTAANQLFSGGLSFLQSLTGNAGTDALTARLSDTSARDALLGALKSSLGDFLTENILPGITSQGVATGTLGGSRDAIARAQAAKAVAGQFSQGAASIISADQAERDQVASQLAALTQQGAGTGLNALSSLLGLQTAGASAALSPFAQLAAILGGPTTLTQSGSTSSQFGSSVSQSLADAISSSFGQQGSQSYGFNYGTGESSSQSTGQGTATGGQQGLLQTLVASLGGMAGRTVGG